MGRQKSPIIHEGPQATFAMELRIVRISCGVPTYRAMAERAHMSHTILSLADRGVTLPTWAVTEAYLRACGVADPAEIDRWRTRYESTRRAIALRNSTMVKSTIAASPSAPVLKTTVQLLPTLGQSEQRPHVDRLDQVLSSADLVAALNDLVSRRGYDTAELSRRINDARLPQIDPARPGQYLTTTEVRRVLTGTMLPARSVVIGIVNACGGSTADIEAWTKTWQRLSRDARRAQATLNELVQQIQMSSSDPKGEITAESEGEIENVPQPHLDLAVNHHPALSDQVEDVFAAIGGHADICSYVDGDEREHWLRTVTGLLTSAKEPTHLDVTTPSRRSQSQPRPAGKEDLAMLKPVELLHMQDSDTAATPIQADYQQAARQLAPLITRVANGDTLTLRQLADIGLHGWRLLDGLLNTPYDTEPDPTNALAR